MRSNYRSAWCNPNQFCFSGWLSLHAYNLCALRTLTNPYLYDPFKLSFPKMPHLNLPGCAYNSVWGSVCECVGCVEWHSKCVCLGGCSVWEAGLRETRSFLFWYGSLNLPCGNEALMLTGFHYSPLNCGITGVTWTVWQHCCRNVMLLHLLFLMKKKE